MTRIAVIGDMGGRVEIFRQVISDLGGDVSTGHLPPNTVVVQVGDLARAEEGGTIDPDTCLAIADTIMGKCPNQWVQLFGNHEASLYKGPRREAWGDTPAGGIFGRIIVRRWWQERSAKLAIGCVDQHLGPVLITHAGLTRAAWKDLGCPGLRRCVDQLNELVGEDPEQAFRAGRLVTNKVDPRAGVVWAEVNMEVYASWPWA
jgi:hypothetical protein